MDYSLIVGIHDETTKEAFEEASKTVVVRPGVGYIYRVDDAQLYETFIGIIGKPSFHKSISQYSLPDNFGLTLRPTYKCYEQTTCRSGDPERQ